MTAARRPFPSLPRLGIGCGTVALGAAGEAFDALVAQAVSQGPCHLDTAPYYAQGLSEARLGEALEGTARDKFILSTKVGRYLAVPGEGTGPFPSSFDYSREATIRSVERSLTRLGTDRLDVVFVHDLDGKQHGAHYEARRGEALRGAIPALRELQSEGVIDHVGVASMKWEACLDLCERAELDVVLLAGGATLLDRGSDPLFAHCARAEVPVIVASPLNSGILATGVVPGARYNYCPPPEDVAARVAAMACACDRHDVPLVAAALQYPARRHAIASLLVGHASIGELRGNEAALNLEIPPGLWAELEAL